MQFRPSRFALLAILVGAIAVAQTPDQINALRSLPQDQQDALIQGFLGKGGDSTTGTTGTTGTSGSKSDQQLRNPQSVGPKRETTDLQEKLNKWKTIDGHRLRPPNEEPELRPDDTVLIDLTPIDTECRDTSALNPNAANIGAGGIGTGNNTNNNGNRSNNCYNISRNTRATGENRTPGREVDDYGRIQLEVKPKTDEEKEKSEAFRQRILRGNPYHLNQFGVLEVPGLPAMPLAGLTADEATARLSADPDLRDFTVQLTLLRLQPLDAEGLKPFGYDLFEGAPSSFASVSDIQVPMDYVVGPGDTFNVQLYGNDNQRYKLTVARDGRVSFPKLGPITVGGMSFDAARDAIEQRVGHQLMGARVSVTMGDLRSIRVFVLGDAETPGSYTVSGLSTMTNALFVSGGVKKIGSLRNIQLKRNGRLVTVLDLYDLLLRGDTSGDRHLMPGDVIFIPPIGDTVAVYGAVRRPAIYELKTEKNAAQALDLAGGMLPDADAKQVQVERILPSRLHQMVNIDLTSSEGRNSSFANGDKVRVPAIRPTLENSVVLSGYVFRPGSFEYRSGLRLSDILRSFDELRPNADRHYIMIRREVPPEERVEVISADLVRALRAPGSATDPELRPRDQIIVFDLSSGRERIVAPVIKDLVL
jgi:protein involved in polysaccharide export with SLBB domain